MKNWLSYEHLGGGNSCSGAPYDKYFLYHTLTYHNLLYILLLEIKIKLFILKNALLHTELRVQCCSYYMV